MAHTEHIRFALEDGVATITLNRPDVLNSINRSMAAGLQAAMDEATTNAAIRCVLLTGEGRAFCAGQDLAEATAPENLPFDFDDVVENSYNKLVRQITELEKPVVCAVNGVAAGAGANLALSCDIVLASDSAAFIQAFIKLGLVPDTGGTFWLPRLVGLARAKALTMLGEKLTAKDAYELGMIYQVVEAENLMHDAQALAKKLAKQPTIGLGLTKRALHESLTNDLPTQLQVERKLQVAAANTNDYREGVAAFVEKRKPDFTGT